MMKKWLIAKGFKFLLIAIVIGLGISYLSSSIGGTSLSYTSLDLFLKQIGVEEGDISYAHGCFLCQYLRSFFETLGKATSKLWLAIIGHLWVLLVIGFGIFLVMHTIQQLRETAKSKDVKDLTSAEPKLDFKKWFDKVWKTAVRVLLAGAFLGVIYSSEKVETTILRTTTNMIVTPVMYIGTALSSQAIGLVNNTTCQFPATATDDKDVLTPVFAPFGCVMSSLNAVILGGAAGGFALMNYSWLGMGGGFFTWVAGLTLVIIFLIIGFDLIFQILNVLFKLIFIIIFMPLLIVAAAFEEVWSLAKGVMNSAIDILIKSAISILKISLKITLIYMIVFYSADSFYPGPYDGFTTIMPPLITEITDPHPDSTTQSVMEVFKSCEQVSVINNEMDKDTFLNCFNARKAYVESVHRGAFDFMGHGFDFFVFMLGVYFLYFWIISPKIDEFLTAKDDKETFNYGDWVKDATKATYKMPMKMYDRIYDKIQGSKS